MIYDVGHDDRLPLRRQPSMNEDVHLEGSERASGLLREHTRELQVETGESGISTTRGEERRGVNARGGNCLSK